MWRHTFRARSPPSGRSNPTSSPDWTRQRSLTSTPPANPGAPMAATDSSRSGYGSSSRHESARPAVRLTHLRYGAASPTHGHISDDGAHGVDLHRRGDRVARTGAVPLRGHDAGGSP